jgi:uncharacterized protein (DUF4415 family)
MERSVHWQFVVTATELSRSFTKCARIHAVSFLPERQGKMKKENIVTYSADQIIELVHRGKDKTDWAKVAALTDEDIEAAMRDDPDWADLMDIDWSKAKVVYPVQKQAISIRLDQDIIDYFKNDGSGYQSRINAVLRHFVNEQKRQAKE